MITWSLLLAGYMTLWNKTKVDREVTYRVLNRLLLTVLFLPPLYVLGFFILSALFGWKLPPL